MPTKYPIVLAHGLFGFAELKLAGSYLPPIHYWRGIKEALTAAGSEVITATVPPAGTIAARAAQLRRNILAASRGRPVNIIAHSMGGLDARYMISMARRRRRRRRTSSSSSTPTTTTLREEEEEEDDDDEDDEDEDAAAADAAVENDVNVRALVTIATPHRGSAVADWLLARVGARRRPRALAQLGSRYMAERFNPAARDDPATRYFSYGAALARRPPLLSPFRAPHRLLLRAEGPNDGLVSVASARWGCYQGTLEGVSHLDLINWTNRLRQALRRWMGEPEPFNAVAFYLEIADMLEKEGL